MINLEPVAVSHLLHVLINIILLILPFTPLEKWLLFLPKNLKVQLCVLSLKVWLISALASIQMQGYI